MTYNFFFLNINIFHKLQIFFFILFYLKKNKKYLITYMEFIKKKKKTLNLIDVINIYIIM